MVPQERAVVRPRRAARLPGCHGVAARQSQVRGRGEQNRAGPERVAGAGKGVRGRGRSARPHLQDPGRAGPLPPVQYRPRRRAAALDRGGPLRSRARRRVRPPRPRGGAAPHREGHRRGPGPLYEGSEGRRERRGGHRQAGRPSVHRGVQEEVRVLVVGGGGREHALAWALKRDTPEATLFAAPGNPGTAQLGTNLEIPATATDELVVAAREHKIDLVVVGPEAPLAAGLADRLRAGSHPVFGPGAAAARIESSKAFAKEVMRSAGVPTAASRTFTALAPALAYIKTHAAPLVDRKSVV